jgi:hypothetical protein
MYTDYILNSQGHGPVGEQLAGCHFDPGLMRPYIDEYKRKKVTVNTGRREYNEETGQWEDIYATELVSDMINSGVPIPVANATSLRKDEWIQLDNVVVKAARERLRAWSDLAGANTFGGFSAMGKLVLEHETMSDPGNAMVDMDGLTEDRNDSPKYQLEGLPLPITHAGFWFSSRKMASSRNSGTPLDTSLAESAGRRVAEMVEKTLIGTVTGITYGDATQYGQTPTVRGYLNHPQRNTKADLTAPTGSNGTTVLSEWLAMRDILYGDNFHGPFMCYTDTAYDRYLDDEFKTNSDKSLRQRLLEIDGVAGIRRLDYMTPTATGKTSTMVWVQMTSNVARAINGMGITTIQWESMGAMKLNFKVMAILVPQLRADFNGNMGLLHGSTAS